MSAPRSSTRPPRCPTGAGARHGWGHRGQPCRLPARRARLLPDSWSRPERPPHRGAVRPEDRHLHPTGSMRGPSATIHTATLLAGRPRPRRRGRRRRVRQARPPRSCTTPRRARSPRRVPLKAGRRLHTATRLDGWARPCCRRQVSQGFRPTPAPRSTTPGQAGSPRPAR